MHGTPPPPSPAAPRARTAVVIDVLRMTSTASVLLRRPSSARLSVAATLEDVVQLSLSLSDCVLVSELAGAPGLGAGTWIDNSPARAARFDFEGRTPVLVTTNGTKTLFAATGRAERVLLASFRDLRAVARHLTQDGPVTLAESHESASSVVLMPAGHIDTGESRLEDDLCAEALASLLAGREPDIAVCAAAIRADARVVRRIEKEPGFAADVDLALEEDPLAGVLEFRPFAAGVGHVTRVSSILGSATPGARGAGASARSSERM